MITKNQKYKWARKVVQYMKQENISNHFSVIFALFLKLLC